MKSWLRAAYEAFLQGFKKGYKSEAGKDWDFWEVFFIWGWAAGETFLMVFAFSFLAALIRSCFFLLRAILRPLGALSE